MGSEALRERHGPTRWFADRSVVFKLGVLIALAVLAVVAVGANTLLTADQAAGRAAELERLNRLTARTLEADMAHDAIRGDVLRSLVATTATEIEATEADLQEHVTIITEGLQTFRDDASMPDVQLAAETVAPAVQEYVDLAARVVGEVKEGRDTPPSYEAFTRSFTDVEENLPGVQDAIAARADRASQAVHDAKGAATRSVALIAGLGILLFVVVARFIVRSILHPLRQVAVVTQALAKGDLTHHVSLDRGDEFGEMANGLDAAVDAMRATMVELVETTHALSTAATELDAISGELTRDATQVADHAVSAATATSQVHDGVHVASNGAEQMMEAINEIADSASKSAAAALESTEVATAAHQSIIELEAASAQIRDIVRLITGIAEQTHLLALNATIEAARAGEAGKGFAVVANEVKDLAHATSRATNEITARITALQTSNAAVADSVGKIYEAVERIKEFSTTVASAVVEQSSTTRVMSSAIADAAAGSAEVSEVVSVVASMSSATAESAKSSREASAYLATLAARLDTLIGGFRFEGDAGTAAGGRRREPALANGRF